MGHVDGPLVRLSRQLTAVDKEIRQLLPDNPAAKGARASTAGISLPAELDAARRALLYVWLAAALEAYVTDSLFLLADWINGTGTPRRDTSLSVLSMAMGAEFDSAADSRRLKRRQARLDVALGVDGSASAAIQRCHLPLDGRTLSPEHFDLIWEVFGFSGPVCSDPQNRLALTDLHDGRNEIAHGRTDPVSFGRRKTLAALKRVQYCVEDHAVRLSDAIDGFIAARGHRR